MKLLLCLLVLLATSCLCFPCDPSEPFNTPCFPENACYATACVGTGKESRCEATQKCGANEDCQVVGGEFACVRLTPAKRDENEPRGYENHGQEYRQLIVNGGFENGLANWNVVELGGFFRAVGEGNGVPTPSAGSKQLGFLGIIAGGGAVYQDFEVPDLHCRHVNLTLTYKLRYGTTANWNFGVNNYDAFNNILTFGANFLRVQITDRYDNVVHTVFDTAPTYDTPSTVPKTLNTYTRFTSSFVIRAEQADAVNVPTKLRLRFRVVATSILMGFVADEVALYAQCARRRN